MLRGLQMDDIKELAKHEKQSGALIQTTRIYCQDI